MRALHAPAVRLFMDNARALAMIMWGKARSGLPEQQRIVRRMTHGLRWQGCSVQLAHELNPAYPVSRWWQGHSAHDIVVQARARQQRAVAALGSHGGQGQAGVGGVPVGRLAGGQCCQASHTTSRPSLAWPAGLRWSLAQGLEQGAGLIVGPVLTDVPWQRTLDLGVP